MQTPFLAGFLHFVESMGSMQTLPSAIPEQNSDGSGFADDCKYLLLGKVIHAQNMRRYNQSVKRLRGLLLAGAFLALAVGVDGQSSPSALQAARAAAERGVASGQMYMGESYRDGDGVPQDYKEAARWFRLAADQGIALAQFNLGYLYYVGQGVPQDHKEAIHWYQLAAEQGLDLAENNLAYGYKTGDGVTQDYNEAVRWYRMAADKGNAVAQTAMRNSVDVTV